MELSVCSLDRFAEEKSLKKIDFIKMDIEGYEANALRGAASVIQKYKPKMAICIYHKPEDIFAIQRQVHDICDRYKFYVKHNSKVLWETVLYCVPTEEKCLFPLVSCSDGDVVTAQLVNLLVSRIKTATKAASIKPISAYSRTELTQILLERHKIQLQASWHKRLAKFIRSCQKRQVEILARYQAWQESKKK